MRPVYNGDMKTPHGTQNRDAKWMPLAFLVALPITALAAEPPPPAGRLLASQCFQCHSSGGFESIKGKAAAEILKELMEMKRKTKPGDIMERHAKGYTDEQARQLAAYLASQPRQDGKPGSGQKDGDDEEENDD